MRIFAIDPSLTGTGWASGPATCGVLVPPSSGRGVVRLIWIRDTVLKLIHGAAADLVAIEGYSFGSNTGRVIERAELGGVIRVALHGSGVPWVEIPPANLKKFATGHGNASKDEVLVAAVRRLEYRGHNNNEADALFLYHYTAAAYGLRSAIKVPQSHIPARPPAWPVIDGMRADQLQPKGDAKRNVHA